jgi:hypothetical protein
VTLFHVKEGRVTNMARSKKMTLDEYVRNRDDMTNVVVAKSEYGYEICVRIDGSYHDHDLAIEQAKFVSKTLGIPLRREGFE